MNNPFVKQLIKDIVTIARIKYDSEAIRNGEPVHICHRCKKKYYSIHICEGEDDQYDKEADR